MTTEWYEAVLETTLGFQKKVRVEGAKLQPSLTEDVTPGVYVVFVRDGTEGGTPLYREA